MLGNGMAATPEWIDGRLLELLGRSPGRSRLAAELGAGLGLGRPELDASLERLSARRRVLVVDHPPPDRHLARADLRVVSELPEGLPREEAEARAVAAAAAVWEAWLRQFLAVHRCG
jgi:hypothetical protein